MTSFNFPYLFKSSICKHSYMGWGVGGVAVRTSTYVFEEEIVESITESNELILAVRHHLSLVSE